MAIKKLEFSTGTNAPSLEDIAEKAKCSISELGASSATKQEGGWLVEVEVPDSKAKESKPKAKASASKSKSSKK